MDRNFAAAEINRNCAGLGTASLFLGLASIKDFLSRRPPYEILRLFYEAGYAEPDVLQHIRDFVGKTFASKNALLKFVYGADSRLTDYTEWQNLRRATAGKKAPRGIRLRGGSTPIQVGDLQGDSFLCIPAYLC